MSQVWHARSFTHVISWQNLCGRIRWPFFQSCKKMLGHFSHRLCEFQRNPIIYCEWLNIIIFDTNLSEEFKKKRRNYWVYQLDMSIHFILSNCCNVLCHIIEQDSQHSFPLVWLRDIVHYGSDRAHAQPNGTSKTAISAMPK